LQDLNESWGEWEIMKREREREICRAKFIMRRERFKENYACIWPVQWFRRKFLKTTAKSCSGSFRKRAKTHLKALEHMH
jgi:hypothetical protein